MIKRFLILLFILHRIVVYSQCVDSTFQNRINLGLYGGPSLDLSYSPSGRLFAAVESPISLFYSDDTCNTWKQAFPNDSLLYECGSRGWGGSTVRVLCNQKGWVAAQTSFIGNTTTSSVINFSEGDSGKWRTAIDGYMLTQLGYPTYPVSSIALSDYYMYVGLGPILVKVDTAVIDASNDIMDVSKQISGMDTTANIVSIAIANHSSGYPFYIVIDTSSSSSTIFKKGNLYKYNGSSFSKITLPSTLASIGTVFTHPAQLSGDTLFISGYDNTNEIRTYRSFNGGISWTEISYNGTLGKLRLSDVDYSSNWKAFTSNGEGVILTALGIYISKDLGNSWNSSDNTTNGLAVHPDNINLISKSYTKTVFISTTGVGGPYMERNNKNLENISVRKVARTTNKSLFYLATPKGLAYTTAYLDSNITSYNKWQTPYGEFPISSISLSSSETIETVAINPFDSLNVITGTNKGFYVTFNGPSGFALITPSGYGTKPELHVKDIAFVDSVTVLLVTGGVEYGSILGDIWRSTNKGLTWTNVSPTGFSSGNTIGMGWGKDTIIYVGTGIYNTDTGYVWKSYDIGVNWVKIGKGPHGYNDLLSVGLPVKDIAVDPRSTDTLYIIASACDPISSSCANVAFVQSTDGALTYHYINSDTLDENPLSVTLNTKNPDSVYVSIGKYIGLYNFKTDSLKKIFQGFPGEQIFDLCYGSIIAGTSTGSYGILYDEDAGIINSLAENEEKENSIIIFPNPASDKLVLKLPVTTTHLFVEVYDMVGKRVKTEVFHNTKNITQYSLDMKSLSNGTYFLSVEYGKQKAYSKLVILR